MNQQERADQRRDREKRIDLDVGRAGCEEAGEDEPCGRPPAQPAHDGNRQTPDEKGERDVAAAEAPARVRLPGKQQDERKRKNEQNEASETIRCQFADASGDEKQDSGRPEAAANATTYVSPTPTPTSEMAGPQNSATTATAASAFFQLGAK